MHDTEISEYIKGHILERNLLKIINVLKPLHILTIFKCIKKLIVEINHGDLNMLGCEKWYY